MGFKEFVLSSSRRLVVPLPGYVGLRLAGSSAQQSLCDPKVQFDTVKAFISRFKPDAALPLLDLTVEAGALGESIIFMDNNAPYMAKEIVKLGRDLDAISIPSPKDGRMRVFIEVAHLMAENFPEMKRGSFVTGPFTLAGQLMGIDGLFKSIVKSADIVHNVIKLSTTVITDYMQAFSDTGISFIVITEPTASLLPKEKFLNFSKPFLSQLIRDAKVPIILHI